MKAKPDPAHVGVLQKILAKLKSKEFDGRTVGEPVHWIPIDQEFLRFISGQEKMCSLFGVQLKKGHVENGSLLSTTSHPYIQIGRLMSDPALRMFKGFFYSRMYNEWQIVTWGHY
jgi:hypothetical protein